MSTKSRSGGKDDVVIDFVVLQESHVPAIEPRRPGRRRARQPGIQQTASASAEPAIAPIARLIPPAALVPRIGREREQTPGRRHRREIQRHAGPMQIHRRLQQALLLPLAAGGGKHRCLAATAGETFLHRVDQRGMRANFQPDVHAEIRERLHRRLANCARAAARRAPVGRVARFARAAIAAHRAEKRDGIGQRTQLLQRLLQLLLETGCIKG